MAYGGAVVYANATPDGNAAPCAYANPVRVYVYREPQLRDISCNAHANPVPVYGLRSDELRQGLAHRGARARGRRMLD